MNRDKTIIVRGGGDIATGVIYALWNAGYSIIVLETEKPSAIRRNVSLCEAVYDEYSKVEDMECRLCHTMEEITKYLQNDVIPIIIDSNCQILNRIKPYALVDAILAKKNLGTNMSMSPFTIALGPGFCAGKDVNVVIETMRGHNLGRIIEKGYALPNTGVPGKVGDEDKKRVIHSPADGCIKTKKRISDIVKEGEIIAEITNNNGENVPVKSTLNGILRGLIRDEYYVTQGFKIADIDPRLDEINNCFTISDKARCLGGAVLQAIGRLEKSKLLKGEIK